MEGRRVEGKTAFPFWSNAHIFKGIRKKKIFFETTVAVGKKRFCSISSPTTVRVTSTFLPTFGGANVVSRDQGDWNLNVGITRSFAVQDVVANLNRFLSHPSWILSSSCSI